MYSCPRRAMGCEVFWEAHTSAAARAGELEKIVYNVKNVIRHSMRISVLILVVWTAWTVTPCSASTGGNYVKEDVALKQDGVSLKLVSSSTLASAPDNRRYSVRNLLDGDAATPWVTHYSEDAVWGDGDGHLHIVLKKPAYVKSITIWNGYQKSDALFRQNQRVKKVSINKVLIGGSGFPLEKSIELQDRQGKQEISLQDGWNPYVNLFRVEGLVLRIDDIYPGEKYQDLCISGITLVYGDQPGYTPRLSFKELEKLIKQHAERTLHGWDWQGLDNNEGELFAGMMYYAASGNSGAYALFNSYAPEGAMDSETLHAIWKPAVDATLALRHK